MKHTSEQLREQAELCNRSGSAAEAEMLLTGADAIAQLLEIREMLDDGQGDDDGASILPEFEGEMSIPAKVEACLHLLERRRDVISTIDDERIRRAARNHALEEAALIVENGGAPEHHFVSAIRALKINP